MASTSHGLALLSTAALLIGIAGCEETAGPSAAAASAAPTAAPAKTAEATVAAAPTASAEPDLPKPSHPCPEGTKGEGTSKKPCEATGNARLVEVRWTGKIDDKGPSFNVANKAKLEVLYGNGYFYFYDKDGKQLDVGGEEKPRPKLGCGGSNIFAGPLKPGEKFVITFSCVKKDQIPEGTAKIEAEMQMVGFTDASGKKSDTFWRNNDLTPDKRPLGGVK